MKKLIATLIAVFTLIHVNDNGEFEVVGRFTYLSDCLSFTGEAPPISKVCIRVDFAKL